MAKITPDTALTPIPAKRYFTIGEVSELCGVKPHVLRYWEQDFTQLKPVKRRGKRRYYQHHEVLLIRRIRELLDGEGFTISGARNRLDNAATGDERRDACARAARAPAAAPPIQAALAAVPPPRAELRALLAGPRTPHHLRRDRREAVGGLKEAVWLSEAAEPAAVALAHFIGRIELGQRRTHRQPAGRV